MAKNKPIAIDSAESATEADLCPADEGAQSDLSSASATESREDAIRSAAYALYEARQGVGGSHEEDWLQAEAQIAQIESPGV